MKKIKLMLCLFGSLLLLLAMGCDKAPQEKAAPAAPNQTVTEKASPKEVKPTVPEKVKAQEIEIKVYYPNNEGTRLEMDSRRIKFTPGQDDKYTAAVKSLLQGAKDRGQTTIIPKQVKLKSLRLEQGTAVADFSREIVKNFVGGSTGEEMMIGSIVNTLTQFPEVKRVKFLVEGDEVETIAGHMDLSLPLERMSQLLP